MFNVTEILEPGTLSEAIQVYADNPQLWVIAGGTDVLIKMHHDPHLDKALLSLRNIKELDTIKMEADGTISIGAMASFNQVFRSEIIRKHALALAEAAVSMGGPQIRNIATIGGNVSNGAVSADSASTLFALNVKLQLASRAGERIIPIQDFYAGPGKVKFEPSEILTAILISREDYLNTGSHYIKYAMRKAMDIATLGVSAIVRLERDTIEDLRIGLGVAAPVPIRCPEAEAYARGQKVSEDVIREIGRLAVKAAKARDSWRASKEYREHLIEVLAQRAVTEAIKRAGGKNVE